MAVAPFDTLKLARALRDRAGFTQEHAEAAADALAEVVVGQVATKQDAADIHAEIGALRTEMHSELAALRAEMHSELAALRAEMTAGFRDVEQRLTIRLGGMLVVITGILLAAKFFG
ncbi:MAG TPA: hypothetical protein VHW66_21005 [Stellaceae bacterium]|jgi:hypothetical protein|nr:hypothetical protein [Stellaceae bacterium]